MSTSAASMSGAALPARPRPEDIDRDVEAALPHVPCQSSCCGGRRCDIRDGAMGVGHGVCLSGIAVSLATSNPYFAIGFGVAEIVVCVAHGLVRKYGDLSAITDRFRNATRIYASAVDAQERVAAGLEERALTLSGDIERLTKEREEFSAIRRDLEGRIAEIQAAASEASSTCSSLRATNASLQERVSQLEKLVGEFKTHIAHFKAENAAIQEGLDTLDDTVPLIDRVDDDLEAAIRHLDAEFDEDLADFGRQILQAEQQSKQIYQFLLAQNKVLEEKVGELQHAVSQIDKFDDDLGVQTEHLTILNAQVAATREELSTLRAEFETVSAELARQRLALEEGRRELSTISEALKGDSASLGVVRTEFEPIATAMTAMRERLEASLSRLSAANASTVPYGSAAGDHV